MKNQPLAEQILELAKKCLRQAGRNVTYTFRGKDSVIKIEITTEKVETSAQEKNK